MSAAPHFRNACLVQATALLACALGALARNYLAPLSEDALAFEIIGFVAAVVLIASSMLLAVKSARRMWSAVLCVLAAVELNVPAVYCWAWLADRPWAAFEWTQLLAPTGFGAMAPAATLLFFIGVAVKPGLRTKRTWLRRTALASGAMAGGAIVFIILPCALWLTGAASKAINFPLVRTFDDFALNRWMNASVPGVLKTQTEKLCAVIGGKGGETLRLAACVWGQLPATRLEENLSDAEDSVVYGSWEGLSKQPGGLFRAALKVVYGKLAVGEYYYEELGKALAKDASVAQIDELLARVEQIRPKIRSSFLCSMRPDRADALPSLEKVLTHRGYTDDDILYAAAELSEKATVNTTCDDIEFKKSKIYEAWRWFGVSSRGFDRLRWECTLAVYARDNDLVARRLAITAMANIYKVKLEATPYCDAMNAHGEPVAMSLEEAEEAAAILERARRTNSAEVFRQSMVSDGDYWAYWGEPVWKWFEECWPDDAERFSAQLIESGHGHQQVIEEGAGRNFGRYGAPKKVRAVLHDSKLYYLRLGLLQGIALGRRTELTEDLKACAEDPEMRTEIAEAAEWALCAMLTPDEARARFDQLLASSSGHEGVVRAARLCAHISDEKTRLEVGRRLIGLKPSTERHAALIGLSKLTPLSPFDFSDRRLRQEWTNTLIGLLDDPDIVARRVAARALANYYEHALPYSLMYIHDPAETKGPDPETIGPFGSFEVIAPVESGGAPFPETPQEQDDFERLRQAIAANRKLQENRRVHAASVAR